MASREMLEDVVERLTEQLKVVAESLKLTSRDFGQALEKIETLGKEHKRVVHQVGELKEKESELIRERVVEEIAREGIADGKQAAGPW